MGSGFVASGTWQSIHIPISRSVYCASSSSKPSCLASLSSLAKHNGRSGGLGKGLVHSSVLSGSSKLKGSSLKQACTANFEEFCYDDMSDQVEELSRKLDVGSRYDEYQEGNTSWAMSKVSRSRWLAREKRKDGVLSMQFSRLKLNALEQSLLGIHPEPPDWPERSEILLADIARKANSLEFPTSLRLLKKKHQQWEESSRQVGEYTAFSSVSKAFSSMVFIIHELHSYALSIGGCLYCEDFKEIISKVQSEMNSSFVWLFQQVFARSPTLVLYVMILLANFMVYSMNGKNSVISDTTPMPDVAWTLGKFLQEPLEPSIWFYDGDDDPCEEGEVSPSESENKDGAGLKLFKFPTEKISDVSSLNDEELNLWNSVLEKASNMQAELRSPHLDHETVKNFVSPVTVNLESDDYDCYSKTDILYQMSLAREPDNTLLLSNYAQFLYLVAHDNNRAEECFRRAVQAEKPDAEALSLYADFLWYVRNDIWAAEEKYLQSLAAEPSNPYYASRYACFLWRTGGTDTCYPLESYDKV
ncbi:uncharacterized protein LOC126802246 [Argentina anserina]|uniref:uncharacterized protein LOC126802246 n=1 Tax=Argentina anserina TaxID=57926 RepID=UPI00217678F6|nr:uncharacterized protein LOC126802246 [Potentilla anserina]XP_050385801.1 uncharacterized protein LOC126802246 [Potentilla anserina]XP_050385802.1 uncharacterized protein LOC126802246 [Potentilla anserina]